MNVDIVVVEAAALLDPHEHIELTGRTFPHEPKLAGRYYYDSPPSLYVEARIAGALVGCRTVVDRAVAVAGRPRRIAGIGIAVDPDHQRRGIGTLLTARTIEEVTARRFDLAVAFLFNPNAEPLLMRAGFLRLAAKVSYVDGESGARVVEEMVTLARNVGPDDVSGAIERVGVLDLGVGTW